MRHRTSNRAPPLVDPPSPALDSTTSRCLPLPTHGVHHAVLLSEDEGRASSITPCPALELVDRATSMEDAGRAWRVEPGVRASALMMLQASQAVGNCLLISRRSRRQRGLLVLLQVDNPRFFPLLALPPLFLPSPALLPQHLRRRPSLLHLHPSSQEPRPSSRQRPRISRRCMRVRCTLRPRGPRSGGKRRSKRGWSRSSGPRRRRRSWRTR